MLPTTATAPLGEGDRHFASYARRRTAVDGATAPANPVGRTVRATSAAGPPPRAVAHPALQAFADLLSSYPEHMGQISHEALALAQQQIAGRGTRDAWAKPAPASAWPRARRARAAGAVAKEREQLEAERDLAGVCAGARC